GQSISSGRGDFLVGNVIRAAAFFLSVVGVVPMRFGVSSSGPPALLFGDVFSMVWVSPLRDIASAPRWALLPTDVLRLVRRWGIWVGLFFSKPEKLENY
ncbi:unnamed protein product, partial [Amoebophrya sp. A120]